MVTVLPVVRRELRVASRRRATFLVRFVGAVVAVILGGVFLLPALLPGAAGPSGRLLLQILGTVSLVLVLLAGPLLTADCLSRERREGTLGFLFLTDLNGIDVAGGKFAALSLVPLHGLLAALPVAALTFCLGGITAGEFWSVQAVLLNSLFFSLALGLWVSSLATEERQAAGITFALLAGAALLPHLAALGIDTLAPNSPWTAVRLLGPAGLFQAAFDSGRPPVPHAFLAGLAFQHFLAWCFLLLAAVVVRHGWRREASQPVPTAESRKTWMQARDEGRWSEGPLAWYAWHQSPARRGAPWLAWGFLILAAAAYALLSQGRSGAAAESVATSVLNTGFYLLKLLLAVHVVYFLQDACRSGAMELLLATPIRSQDLCRGHLAAIQRLFLRPFLILALGSVALPVIHRLLDGGDWPSLAVRVAFGALPGSLSAGLHGLDLAAVAWHASRWALHYDRPAKAMLRTALLVLLLPALFCSVGRLFVDLYVLLQYRPMLERFRDLVRGWYFPGLLGTGYGAPRTG